MKMKSSRIKLLNVNREMLEEVGRIKIYLHNMKEAARYVENRK